MAVKQVDARMIETDFTNDAAGRVLTRTYPSASPENVTYSYDSTAGGNKGVGQLTSVADHSGSTSFTYDALGHVITDARVVGANSYSIAYTYDAAGNILTATYPSGRIVTYTRDALGRILGITTKQNSGSSAVTVASGVSYKPFGPLAGLTFGNGVVLAQSLDQDYQLTGINAANGGTTIQNLTNGFDPAGNITSITDGLTSGRSQTVSYDNLNRVLTASGIYGSQTYAYDGVGNRQSLAAGSTSNYTYAATANQIASITNMVPPATGSGTYLYNAFRQRVQKVAGGTTTQFLYDQAGHLLEKADGSGTVQREYIWLDDMPVAMVDSTGTPTLYFIHTDQLGTPQKLTDGSMAVMWDGVFDPFGNPASGASLAKTNLRLPGQYFDVESSLNQHWNRDYDSVTGRYVQSDPVWLLRGTNPYAYAESNPVKSIDPFGLWQVTVSGGNGAGGSISFGHNSGQWNVSVHAGAAEGFSAKFSPFDTGCQTPGLSASFKFERDFKIGNRGFSGGLEIGGNAGIAVGVSAALGYGFEVGGQTAGVPNRPSQPPQSSASYTGSFGGGTSIYAGWGPTIVW